MFTVMDRDENIEHEFQDDIFVIVKHIVQDITGKRVGFYTWPRFSSLDRFHKKKIRED